MSGIRVPQSDKKAFRAFQEGGSLMRISLLRINRNNSLIFLSASYSRSKKINDALEKLLQNQMIFPLNKEIVNLLKNMLAKDSSKG